jgi:hypothetical protein
MFGTLSELDDDDVAAGPDVVEPEAAAAVDVLGERDDVVCESPHPTTINIKASPTTRAGSLLGMEVVIPFGASGDPRHSDRPPTVPYLVRLGKPIERLFLTSGRRADRSTRDSAVVESNVIDLLTRGRRPFRGRAATVTVRRLSQSLARKQMIDPRRSGRTLRAVGVRGLPCKGDPDG